MSVSGSNSLLECSRVAWSTELLRLSSESLRKRRRSSLANDRGSSGSKSKPKSEMDLTRSAIPSGLASKSFLDRSLSLHELTPVVLPSLLEELLNRNLDHTNEVILAEIVVIVDLQKKLLVTVTRIQSEFLIPNRISSVVNNGGLSSCVSLGLANTSEFGDDERIRQSVSITSLEACSFNNLNQNL